MTVRAKTELSKALSYQGVTAIWARSNVTGELQIQVDDVEGKLTSVFIPSSAGLQTPRLVNLLDFAPAPNWKKSRSLLAAVRLGHVSVTLEQSEK